MKGKYEKYSNHYNYNYNRVPGAVAVPAITVDTLRDG